MHYNASRHECITWRMHQHEADLLDASECIEMQHMSRMQQVIECIKMQPPHLGRMQQLEVVLKCVRM